MGYLRLLLSLSVILVALNGAGLAQDVSDIGNGAKIMYDDLVRGGNGAIDPGDYDISANVVRRMIRDRGQPILGYKLRVTAKASDDFLISWEPMDGWPFFSEKPPSREVHAGEWVALDPVVQPSTGAEIADIFMLGPKDSGFPPEPKDIPQIPKGALTIQLDHPKLDQGLGSPALGTSQSLVAGDLVGVRDSIVGQITFSSQPSPGFKMGAVAEEKSIAFVVGNRAYRVACNTPITNLSGTWYLWVNYEPPKVKPTVSVEAGSTSMLELFAR